MRTLLLMPLFAMLLSGADVAGIWMGEKQDIAFQLRQSGDTVSGTMFGDEFDLPIEGVSIAGDHISFYVTSTDYRDRKKTKAMYEGTIAADGTMQLSRERPGGAAAGAAGKQTFVLKRVTGR